MPLSPQQEDAIIDALTAEGATDDEIVAELARARSAVPDPSGSAVAFDALAGGDLARGFGKRALESVSDLGTLARKIPGVAQLDKLMTPVEVDTTRRTPMEQVGGAAELAAELYAPTKAAVSVAKKVPGVVAKGLGISKARAGANIAEAVTAAKDAVVPVEKLVPALDDMLQYKGIENVPRAARALSGRVAQGPLTVETARKYYPAISRGSANEFNNLTPNMQRLQGTLRAVLNDAITAGAETVGKGEQYAAGMKEYAKAAKWAKRGEEAAPAIRKVLRRLLEGGAAAVGAKSAWDFFD